MRLKLIGCQLLARELCDAVVRSPHLVDVEFLTAGLHNDGARAMRTRIQRTIDAADSGRYDAVVLGYALCGGGLAGITARDARLVLPRAHDCITLLLGGRGRYNDCFSRNCGVYYRSSGWVERADEMTEQYLGMANELDLDTLIDRYGEDNGRYLYEESDRLPSFLQRGWPSSAPGSNRTTVSWRARAGKPARRAGFSRRSMVTFPCFAAFCPAHGMMIS